MLIDIGVNLADKRFAADRDAVVERARAAGVEAMVLTGTRLATSAAVAELAAGRPGVLFSTAGVHPHDARGCDDETLEALRALAADEQVVAIGECGLDFYRDLSPRDVQERWFEAQVELAASLSMPLFLHERDAQARFLALLDPHLDALGAVVVFYFGLFGGAMAVPLGGFVGALGALLLLYLMAGRSGDVMTLILAGIAINAFTGALTSLALNLAPSPWAALEIVFWMLGSLADRSMDHVAFAAPFALAGAALILTTGRALDALSLGQDTARSLGFSPQATTIRVILGTGLAVGALVSVTGMIGFVGLVVPHLLRPWVGHHPSRLLLPSALAGAAILLAADILVRLPLRGPELKLGVVTALVGAPFFLHLILQARRSAP